MIRILFSLLLALSTVGAATYYAYFPYESDSVLTAWLIKRYKDPGALFAGIEKGRKASVPPVLQINTTSSLYRRSSRFTAFESAKRRLGVSDSCTQKLVKVSRLLEMAPWRKQQFPEYLELERKIHDALPEDPGPHDLSEAFSIIDDYCKENDR